MTKETGDECKCMKVRIGNPGTLTMWGIKSWPELGIIKAEDVKKRIAEIKKANDRNKRERNRKANDR